MRQKRVELKNNLEELSGRLQMVEASTEQSLGANAARLYAGAVMHEMVSPLEMLNNLLFLLQFCPGDPERVARYVEMAQGNLLQLNEIARRTLLFSRSGEPQ